MSSSSARSFRAPQRPQMQRRGSLGSASVSSLSQQQQQRGRQRDRSTSPSAKLRLAVGGDGGGVSASAPSQQQQRGRRGARSVSPTTKLRAVAGGGRDNEKTFFDAMNESTVGELNENVSGLLGGGKWDAPGGKREGMKETKTGWFSMRSRSRSSSRGRSSLDLSSSGGRERPMLASKNRSVMPMRQGGSGGGSTVVGGGVGDGIVSGGGGGGRRSKRMSMDMAEVGSRPRGGVGCVGGGAGQQSHADAVNTSAGDLAGWDAHSPENLSTAMGGNTPGKSLPPPPNSGSLQRGKSEGPQAPGGQHRKSSSFDLSDDLESMVAERTAAVSAGCGVGAVGGTSPVGGHRKPPQAHAAVVGHKEVLFGNRKSSQAQEPFMTNPVTGPTTASEKERAAAAGASRKGPGAGMNKRGSGRSLADKSKLRSKKEDSFLSNQRTGPTTASERLRARRGHDATAEVPFMSNQRTGPTTAVEKIQAAGAVSGGVDAAPTVSARRRSPGQGQQQIRLSPAESEDKPFMTNQTTGPTTAVEKILAEARCDGYGDGNEGIGSPGTGLFLSNQRTGPTTATEMENAAKQRRNVRTRFAAARDSAASQRPTGGAPPPGALSQTQSVGRGTGSAALRRRQARAAASVAAGEGLGPGQLSGFEQPQQQQRNEQQNGDEGAAGGGSGPIRRPFSAEKVQELQDKNLSLTTTNFGLKRQLRERDNELAEMEDKVKELEAKVRESLSSSRRSMGGSMSEFMAGNYGSNNELGGSMTSLELREAAAATKAAVDDDDVDAAARNEAFRKLGEAAVKNRRSAEAQKERANKASAQLERALQRVEELEDELEEAQAEHKLRILKMEKGNEVLQAEIEELLDEVSDEEDEDEDEVTAGSSRGDGADTEGGGKRKKPRGTKSRLIDELTQELDCANDEIEKMEKELEEKELVIAELRTKDGMDALNSGDVVDVEHLKSELEQARAEVEDVRQKAQEEADQIVRKYEELNKQMARNQSSEGENKSEEVYSELEVMDANVDKVLSLTAELVEARKLMDKSKDDAVENMQAMEARHKKDMENRDEETERVRSELGIEKEKAASLEKALEELHSKMESDEKELQADQANIPANSGAPAAENSVFEEKIKETEGRVSQLEGQVAGKDAEIRRLEEQLRMKGDEVYQLQDAVRERDVELEGLHGDLEETRHQLETYIANKEEDDNNLVADAEREIETLGKELEQANLSLSDKTDELKKAEGNLQAMNFQLQDVSKECDELRVSVKRFEEQLVNFRVELEGERKSVAMKADELEVAKGEIDTLTAEMLSLQSDLASSRVEVTDTSARCAELEVEKTKLTTDLNQSSAAVISELKARVSCLQAELDNKSSLARSVESKAESAHTELAEARRRCNILESKHDAMSEELNKLRESEAKVADLESVLQSTQSELGVKRTEFENMEETVLAIRKELEEAQDLCSKLQGVKSSLADELKENETLRKEVEKAQKELRSIKQEKEKVQSANDINLSELESANIELKKTKEALSCTEEKLKSMDTELDESKKKCKDLDEENQKLIADMAEKIVASAPPVPMNEPGQTTGEQAGSSEKSDEEDDRRGVFSRRWSWRGNVETVAPPQKTSSSSNVQGAVTEDGDDLEAELADRDERIKVLEQQVQANQEMVNRLRSDLVRLSSCYKDDDYINKQTIEKLKAENAHYSMRIKTLELELKEYQNMY